MTRILCYSVILVSVVVYYVDAQYQSPCPKLFGYRSDGAGVYGIINLEPTGGAVSSLHIRANFTVAARLLTAYVGQIETVDKRPNILQNFNRGFPLTYRVNFPVTSPLPRLTAIVVNEHTLCYGPGDIPAPNQFITTISLDHMLFLKAGSRPGFINQIESAFKPDSEDYFGSVGDNTLPTIIINDDKDSWDSSDSQGNNYSASVPVYEQSSSFEPIPAQPTWPRPQRPDTYYPESTTVAKRPPQRPASLPPPTVPPIPSTPFLQPEVSMQIECGMIAGGGVSLIYQGNSFPRGDLPWLVAIYKRQEGSLTFICAGSLVSDRHIVTAAHCMQQKSKISKIKDMVVKIGVYNLEDWGDDISVTRTLKTATIHESYNATTLENDILVFTLDRTVKFNAYIRPVCLWNGHTDLARIVGASGVVAGWGASERGPVGQGEPRMVRVPIVSTAQCRASKPEFHKLTSARTLCAGDRNGSGPCLGDSGGGLYILHNGRWRIRGIVSLSLRPQNGDNTCNLNEYIVFTDAAQYLGWIRKILSQNYFDTW